MGRNALPPGRAASQRDQTVGGRYRLERSLGNGGMGEVFVATDTVLARRVALKRLSPALTDDEPARARFFREARALARINAPNVVAVFDAGGDGDPYLVMELIEGTTLRDEMRAGRLAPERATAIAAGVAAGLAAAHAQGVIHRDVKPSNIFLTASGEPKVGDFGIARIERGDMTLTMTGQAFGSPAYVAPEQATGGHVDARADLYSLGCVLYEMVAGRRPFDGGDAVSLTYQHVHTKPVPLDSVDARVAPELASLVEALLAKDPEDRPRSADDVRRALDPTSPNAVAMTPPAAPEREGTAVLPRRAATLGSRQKRPWWLVAAVAGVILLASLALASAFTGGGPPADQPSSPPGQSASRAASPSATVTATASQPIPSTPEQAGAALVSLAQGLKASGAIDKHLADEVEHTVGDVLERQGDPQEALDKLGELKNEIADELDKGKIGSAEAAQLNAAIDRLEGTLPSGGSEGD
jgi:serine/threonine protein kinase